MKTLKMFLASALLMGLVGSEQDREPALRSGIGAEGQPSPQLSAMQRLVSSDHTTRVAAKDEILAAHKESVDNLIAIVKKKRTDYTRDDQKLLAVQLLGELRAVNAVETLLDNLAFCPPQVSSELVPQEIHPCVGALIEIGRPAVKAIMGELDLQLSEDRPSRLWLYTIIVRDVEGHVAGRAILEDELNSRRTPPGSVKEANIREMLRYFEE